MWTGNPEKRPTFTVVKRLIQAARKSVKEPKERREVGALATGSAKAEETGDAGDDDDTLSDDEDLLQDADGGNALYGTVEAADGGSGELYDIPVMPDLDQGAQAAVQSQYSEYRRGSGFGVVESEPEEEEEEEEVVLKKKTTKSTKSAKKSTTAKSTKKGIKKKRRGSVVVKKDGTEQEESVFDWGFEMDAEDGEGGGAPAAPVAKSFVEKPIADRGRRRGSANNVEIVKMQRASMRKAKAKGGRRSSADEAMEEFGFGFDDDGTEFGFGSDDDGDVDMDAVMSAPAAKPAAAKKKKAAKGGGGGGGDAAAPVKKKKKKKKGTGTSASTTSAAGGKKKTTAKSTTTGGKKKAARAPPNVPDNLTASFLKSARKAPGLGPGMNF